MPIEFCLPSVQREEPCFGCLRRAPSPYPPSASKSKSSKSSSRARNFIRRIINCSRSKTPASSLRSSPDPANSLASARVTEHYMANEIGMAPRAQAPQGGDRRPNVEETEDTRSDLAVVSRQGYFMSVMSNWVAAGNSLRDNGMQLEEEAMASEVGESRTFFGVGDVGVVYEDELEGVDDHPEDARRRLVTLGIFKSPNECDGLGVCIE